MKLQTSYFNSSVLRKNLIRFAPLWALYTIFWILLVSMNLSDAMDTDARARYFAMLTRPLSYFNILYAGLCAFLLFGDLFNSRRCNALHAMPMRREGWLLTHSATALIFALIPYVLTCVLAVAMMSGYLWLAALWLAVAVLQFLFFFGLAVFSVMCAGSPLGMGAVYFILNFFFLLVYALYYLLYEPLLHGIALDSIDVQPFVPVIYLLDSHYVTVNLMHEEIYTWNAADWYYLFACAAIGIAAWSLSFLLYRRRALECAGDFVAFRPVAPVFLVFYTLGAGALLHLFAEITASQLGYIFLAIGILIGFFTGRMLLEKTVRVFRPKVFIQLLVLAVILAGSIVLTRLDPLGITYYIPKADEITGMRIYSQDNFYLYKTDIVAQNHLTTDPEEIEQLRAMHKTMTLERGKVPPDNITCDVNVVYYLSDGSTCKRCYSIDPASQLGAQLEYHLSDYRQVFFINQWEPYAASVKTVWANSFNSEQTLPFDENGEYHFTDEQITQLLAALKADCDAGNMVQDWSYFNSRPEEEGLCWLYLENDMSVETKGTSYYTTGTRHIELYITDRCVNTAAFFKSISE